MQKSFQTYVFLSNSSGLNNAFWTDNSARVVTKNRREDGKNYTAIMSLYVVYIRCSCSYLFIL